MSWDELEKKTGVTTLEKEAKAKQAQLAKDYKRLFESEQGQRVLTDLTQRFVWNNDTALDAKNVTYEAGYHNGETGVIKFIHHLISQAGKI